MFVNKNIFLKERDFKIGGRGRNKVIGKFING